MSAARFDELVHAPTRLAVVSLLAAPEWADFKFIRDSVGLCDSALSKQLTTLEEAGYVEIRKGFVGKRAHHGATDSRRAGRLRAARGSAAGGGGPVRRHHPAPLTWVAVGPALLSLRPPRPGRGQWLIRPG